MQQTAATTEAPTAGGPAIVEPPQLDGAPTDGLRVPSVRRREVIRRRDALYRRVLALADMSAIGVALLAAVRIGDDALTLGSVLVPVGFVFVVKAMGLYDRDEHLLHKATLDEVPSLFGVATLAVLLVWFANGLIVAGDLERNQVLAAWLLLLVGLVCLRSFARAVARYLTPVERCLLVAGAATADYVNEKLLLSPAVKAELVGLVESEQLDDRSGPSGEMIGNMIDRYDVERVILVGGSNRRDELLYTIRELKTYGVKVSVLPEASRVAGSSVELDHLHGMTLLGVRRFDFTRSSRWVKRTFDIVCSATGLLLLAPVLTAIAIAIRLDSRGPVLFRQTRVGRHGDEFRMVKFRSMVAGADRLKADYIHLNEGARGLFKIGDDPRVTRVGRVLRGWQLDELPQLFNVLRGEMSLVGPRPLIPEEDRQIEGWYRRRLDVPPGITGHWQVLGSSRRIPLAEMVKLDYLYVANWSLWGDITLLIRTIPFLIHRRGV